MLFDDLNTENLTLSGTANFNEPKKQNQNIEMYVHCCADGRTKRCKEIKNWKRFSMRQK